MNIKQNLRIVYFREVSCPRICLPAQVAPGDVKPFPFSFLHLYRPGWAPSVRQVDCYETHTTSATEAFVTSCVTSGRGWQAPQGRGAFEEGGMAEPRYCPSLETKFRRFPGRSHHVSFPHEGEEHVCIFKHSIIHAHCD